ncbi:hypothetical protein X798_03596 [Onchocerca flexuosa]|uniref:Leucine Rich repeat-containing domain protein n=1 Tax=Onchocerca flexuosa TaxID=387005 RepID=A0A238BXE9_9BILA|nr:hypothetical protein X798_03596 [Onchocerca flexuosa]
MTMAQRNEMMTDADLLDAIQALGEQEPHDEVKELLKMMSDNRIITWEEAEQIMGYSSYNRPIKSSLPQPTRPTEPDNDTDVDWSIQQLRIDDPKLKQVNLNNMKPIFDVIASNTTLKSINLETNYLSGDFFARLFKAALVNQTLEEVKAVNQGVTFATAAEKEIIDAVFENRGLTKVSINLRLPEGPHKIENAMIRNQEIRRILRRQAAAAIREAEVTQKEVNKPVVPKQEISSRKSQPTKPAIIENASPIPSVKKQSPNIVEDCRQASIDINNIFEKTSSTVIRNYAKTSSHTVESDKKTISATLEKASTADRQAKVPNIINRTASNEVIAKTITPPESLPIVDAAKIRTKKTGLKRASTKTKTTDTVTETVPGKAKSKKIVPRKISLEQAVPEMELDTEEMLRKISVPKKSSLTVKKSSAPFGSNETVTPAFTNSMLSRWQNNSSDNSVKNNSEMPEKTEFPTKFLFASYKRIITGKDDIIGSFAVFKDSRFIRRLSRKKMTKDDMMIEWRKQRGAAPSSSEIGQRPLYDNMNFFSNESFICCKHGVKCSEYYGEKFDKKKISSLWPISELLGRVGKATSPIEITSGSSTALKSKKSYAMHRIDRFYIGQRPRSTSILLTRVAQSFRLYHELPENVNNIDNLKHYAPLYIVFVNNDLEYRHLPIQQCFVNGKRRLFVECGDKNILLFKKLEYLVRHYTNAFAYIDSQGRRSRFPDNPVEASISYFK